MLQKTIDFLRWTQPWRQRFGMVQGLRIGLALRRAIWGAPTGATVKVEVPGIRHPLRLRAGTSDPEVFGQVFGDRQADFPVTGSPMVVVDAGANIGLTAVVFATRFPSAKILALEIDPENFALLEKNTRPYPNIRAIRRGLWSKRTRIRITNPQADSWAYQTSEAQEDDQTSIEAIGVQDILSDPDYSRIDLLKIDIEGGELEVFRDGVEEWIGSVDMVAVEVHDRLRPGCSDAVRRALQPRGFEESRWSEYLLFRREPSA